MPNRRVAETLASPPLKPSPNLYGDEKIEDIIKKLDLLKDEARKSGNDDVYHLIESTFSICLQSYCIIKRHELESFLSATQFSKTN